MKSKPESPWFPQYEGPLTYQVEDIQIDECPVSFITPQTRHLVEMDHQAQRLKDATGAALLGMDSGQWPAWWADAVACFEVQRVLEHNARSRAEIEEAKRQQK